MLIPAGRGTALRLPHRDDRKGRPYHSEQYLWFHLDGGQWIRTKLNFMTLYLDFN
jgi:hypothetical protein